jgi:hypothetical protein
VPVLALGGARSGCRQDDVEYGGSCFYSGIAVVDIKNGNMWGMDEEMDVGRAVEGDVWGRL